MHTQHLQILREDTLGATCSAGPFCLLPRNTREGLKGFFGKLPIFHAAGSFFPDFPAVRMLSLPRFGHFPARKLSARQSAPPSGTLLDFLFRYRHHSLLEFFLKVCLHLFAFARVCLQTPWSHPPLHASDEEAPRHVRRSHETCRG